MSALANIHPGRDDNYVNYRNDDRAPLLFIAGSVDNLMPPKIQRSNAKHYTSDTVLGGRPRGVVGIQPRGAQPRLTGRRSRRHPSRPYWSRGPPLHRR